MRMMSPPDFVTASWAHDEAARRRVAVDTLYRIIKAENELMDEIEDDEDEE